MLLWGRVGNRPEDEDITAGQRISDKILYEAGVFITPGFIFGRNGNNYIRISLCAKPETLRQAWQKIKTLYTLDGK
jgi:aspartate/methionine/tyrosine aminotransferase